MNFEHFATVLFVPTTLLLPLLTTTAAASPPIEPTPVALKGDLDGFRSELETKVVDGVQLVTLRLAADKPTPLPQLRLTFDFASVDIAGYWNPQQTLDKVNYYNAGFTSGASQAAPVLCYYDNGLRNRLTVAASDALTTLKFKCGLKEEDVRFYASVELFTEKTAPVREYILTLRLDCRAIPYHHALAGVRRWWEAMPAYHPAAVPDKAKRPMYSTWYSYHQMLDPDKIVEECRLARAFGCHAVIVDDGWQTNDSNRGYAYTGDWQPERLTAMRDFVDRVHNEDMSVLLWYSLPFMGEKADNFERFQGKYLYHWKATGAYVLDPRYPEVREFMIDTYEKALREWNLDGFKLDFIGWFKAYGDTKLTAEDGRDYASVGEATDRLMTDICQRLLKLKPDVMIEFRQPYVGPVMRKYGNMLRGVDCPNNAAANRNEIANLRLLSGETAVHSDMFIWHPGETLDAAALQILNVLFSVPQVSVRLTELPEAHQKMIAFWLNYWNDNRDILLEGDFFPGNPGANYPTLSTTKDGRQITVLYETPYAVQLGDRLTRIDVINATGNDYVTLDVSEEWSGCTTRLFDVAGQEIDSEQTNLSPGPHRFAVPPSGMLRIEQD